MEFKGKIVLVTGASSGIGLQAAAMFLEKGATVYLNGRSREKIKRVIESLDGLPGTALVLPGDVSSVKQCETMINHVEEDGRGLDILVNSAGIWVEGDADRATEADWDSTMNINAKGTFFMCRYAIHLLEKSEGVIINVGSDAGIMGNKGAVIYSASKGAVTLLTRALAVELAPRGIRVNAVCPGEVDTPMQDKAIHQHGEGDREAYIRKMLEPYPQGDRARLIRPGEVAAAILFLASPAATAITGACLSVDFGVSAGY